MGGVYFCGQHQAPSVYNEGWTAKTDSNGLRSGQFPWVQKAAVLSQVIQLRDGSYAAWQFVFGI